MDRTEMAKKWRNTNKPRTVVVGVGGLIWENTRATNLWIWVASWKSWEYSAVIDACLSCYFMITLTLQTMASLILTITIRTSDVKDKNQQPI